MSAAATSAVVRSTDPGRQAAPSQLPAAALVKHLAAGSVQLPPSLAGFEFSSGLALDGAGNLYAGLLGNGFQTRVAVFDAQRNFVRDWSPNPASGQGSTGPALAIGRDGVYVRNRDVSDGVRVFTPEGIQVRQFGVDDLLPVGGFDIEVDAAGNVYVLTRACCGVDADHVVRFNDQGQVTGRLVPIPGLDSGSTLRGIALDTDGSLWVTSAVDPFLVHLDASGAVLPGAPRLGSLLEGPSPEDIDLANGRLYVAGRTHADRAGLAVLTPSGLLVDRAGPAVALGNLGHQVAVRGLDVYVRGVSTAVAGGARTAQAPLVPPGVGYLQGKPIREPDPGDTDALYWDCPGSTTSQGDFPVPYTVVGSGSLQGCAMTYINRRDPCPGVTDAGDEVDIAAGTVYLNNNPVPGGRVRITPREELGHGTDYYAEVVIPPGQVTAGTVVVEFACEPRKPPFRDDDIVYEWKGTIDVHDPSGNVLDARSRRPVEAATVLLQFALRQGAPFGRPGISGFVPQINPQLTNQTGAFAWDVAPGLWRLRITAFGYRPYTSRTYTVPPPVTGLRLRMRQNRAQQRRLIDPRRGRVGDVRLGARRAGGRRAAGLRLKLVRGRVRAIVVRSRRYRTAHGVRLGSPRADVLSAYSASLRAAPRRLARARTLRVGKGRFTFSGKGRLRAIVLRR